MDEATKKEVEEITRKVLRQDFSKRIGDTPTDALQLANKKYVDAHSGGAVYSAVISNTGTVLSGSSAISVAHPATGKFTITHNLGTTSYAAFAEINELAPGATTLVTTVVANSFQVFLESATLTLSDFQFYVIIHKHG